jgi:C1A family cysteine protease
VAGGHADLAVGYKEEQLFRVRNSRSADCGQDGYCTMQYAYMTTRTLSSSFCTIQEITENDRPS